MHSPDQWVVFLVSLGFSDGGSEETFQGTIKITTNISNIISSSHPQSGNNTPFRIIKTKRFEEKKQ
jgi:hypothetical protein